MKTFFFLGFAYLSLLTSPVLAKEVADNSLDLKTDRIENKTDKDTGVLDARTASLFDADDQVALKDKENQKTKQASSEQASLFTQGQISLTQLASTQGLFKEADGSFLRKVTQRTVTSEDSQDWTVLYAYLVLVALVILGLAFLSRPKGDRHD